MQRLASALLLPFYEDKETRLVVAEALIEQNHHAQCERSDDPEYLVIRALGAFCHQKGRSTALVGEVAEKINTTRKSLGEEADLKARKVGAILKAIGLGTEEISRFGRGLRLTTGVRRKIHELARAYGLQPSGPACAKCSFCADTFGGDTVGKASTAAKVNV
jgi:transcription initiation factor TFIIIB Brf1 subunit/transcription initiation factor TFIIB